MFPFTYKGISYDKCTTVDNVNPWCSTLTNAEGEHVDGEGKWGYCPSDHDSVCGSMEQGIFYLLIPMIHVSNKTIKHELIVFTTGCLLYRWYMILLLMRLLSSGHLTTGDPTRQLYGST